MSFSSWFISASYVPLYAPGFFSCVGRMADTHVLIGCLLRSSSMNMNMTPLMGLGMFGLVFLRAPLVRASCTLHPVLPCYHYRRAFFNCSCLGRASRSQFSIFCVCFTPSRPTCSFRTAFLRSNFGLVYRTLFSPLFSTWHPTYVYTSKYDME